MTRAGVTRAAFAALAVLTLAGAAAPRDPSRLRTLWRKLETSGRAQARLEQRRDGAAAHRGRIALERGQVELVFDGGERITLRADGGEWLQPALQQMLVIDAGQAEGARRWWSAMTERDAAATVTRAGSRAYVLALDGDTARVTLDAAGLPARLAFGEPTGGRVEYRFSAWRFAAARGRPAFVIVPGNDVRVVDLR